MVLRSIKGYLGDKICILVTHQVQFLQDATKILVLDHVCVCVERGWGVKDVCVCVL